MNATICVKDRSVLWASIEEGVDYTRYSQLINDHLRDLVNCSDARVELFDLVHEIVSTTSCTRKTFDRYALKFVSSKYPLLRGVTLTLLADTISSFLSNVAASVRAGTLSNLKEVV
jgi:hypothetical protein